MKEGNHRRAWEKPRFGTSASWRVSQKENATAFRFISLGSRAGPSRGAAFLKGKAASAAVVDLAMRKCNRFGGVLFAALFLL